MRLSDMPIPEIYLESFDFRFFLRWFESVISKTRFDTENILDLYDPQRCPEHLLWMLGDTMGYKYDSRLSPAFCRLVLLYFMSMIRYKGSKSGVTLAAEVNLAQFNIQEYGQEKDILKNRLEDTSIPVNSVYVTAHTPEGFIDVVYFSDRKPIDACIEYVRPLGMYCFQHAGVKYDGRTKISIDARLTNINDTASGEGITRVGHYSREDYARMQKMRDEELQKVDSSHTRELAWKRNQPYEDTHPLPSPEGPTQDAGYRALYSLQMSNSAHITKSLLKNGPIFDLEYGPQDIGVEEYNTQYAYNQTPEWRKWNLRYNKTNEVELTDDVFTIDYSRTSDAPPKPASEGGPSFSPVPAVNPIMAELGDAMTVDKHDSQDFTGVTRNSVLVLDDIGYTISRVSSCKYGDLAQPESTYVELVEGIDYTMLSNTIVKMLPDSTIIPGSPISGKVLRIYFNYADNTKYTKYDVETGKIDIEDVEPRNTKDNS